MNVKDKYKVLDAVGKRMKEYKTKYPAIYQEYADYMKVHNISVTKKGVLSKGKQNLQKSDAIIKALDRLTKVSEIQEKLRKTGEEVTKENIDKVVYVNQNLDAVKGYLYNVKQVKTIEGLSDTKGKTTYSELYGIIKKYEKEIDDYYNNSSIFDEEDDFE